MPQSELQAASGVVDVRAVAVPTVWRGVSVGGDCMARAKAWPDPIGGQRLWVVWILIWLPYIPNTLSLTTGKRIRQDAAPPSALGHKFADVPGVVMFSELRNTGHSGPSRSRTRSGGLRSGRSLPGHGLASNRIEVGTPVARRPPHRSRRAVFPHRALQVNSLSHAPADASAATVAAADRNSALAGKALSDLSFPQCAGASLGNALSSGTKTANSYFDADCGG